MYMRVFIIAKFRTSAVVKTSDCGNLKTGSTWKLKWSFNQKRARRQRIP